MNRREMFGRLAGCAGVAVGVAVAELPVTAVPKPLEADSNVCTIRLDFDPEKSAAEIAQRMQKQIAEAMFRIHVEHYTKLMKIKPIA